MPKENHDRTIEVRLAPGGVAITYRLEVDESRAELDVARLELPPDEFARITTAAALHAAFLKHVGPGLQANLDVRLDGRPLTLHGAGGKRDESVTDHLRGVFVFRAPWELTPGKMHTFSFRENNYDQEDFDRIQVTLTADPGLTLRQTTAPDRALLERPPLERKPGDDERLRTASASFILDKATVSRGEGPPPEAEGGGAAEETGDGRPQKLLHLLLDTRRGVVVLLLLAAGFGAAHALTPGHGKTLVAAYLVGAHGTVWHALLLGMMTTLTHTAAVFVLALLFLLWPSTAVLVYYLQGLVGGLFIAGLGLWLLIQRLTGHADHFHLGGHHHHHHHDHAPHPLPAGGGLVRGWHLILLGVRGGMVPCWDAILLLCLAISAKRVWLGVPLLLAFSTGLAGVLVALGVGVVWARDWAVGRFGEGPRARKLVGALPVVSAVVILALGLWLCYDSLHPAAPGH